jgi:hypothetical protein
MDRGAIASLSPEGMATKKPPQAPVISAPEALTDRLRGISALSSEQLRREWQRLYRVPPPQSLRRDLLLRGIAYRIQEQTLGGLRPSTLRRLNTLGRTLHHGDSTGALLAPSLKTGTKLLREWRGETHCVFVLDEGFSYRETQYRSLTQIAKLITGVHWSGPRFFGTGRSRPSARRG